MCTLLSGIIFCLGILGYSSSIDFVAERRYNVEWGQLSNDPKQFDVLLGVEDCQLLNRSGYLLTDNNIYSALIVDCNNPQHTWPKYYLGDINRGDLTEGYLILTQGRSK